MARVPVISPEGQSGTVEDSDLAQALAAGFQTAEKPSATLHGLKQGLTAGLAPKIGAALDATAASINQWARQHAPALVPDEPTITETRTGGTGQPTLAGLMGGGGGPLSWSDRYENSLRVSRAMDAAAEKDDPNQYKLMNVVGGLAPASKVLDGAKGVSLIGRSAALSAAEGAGDSNGATIGDVVGDAAIRGSLGAVAALPVAALDKVPALRDWLASKARIEAFKQAAAGNAKSLAGRLGGASRAEQVGQFILDEGMLSRGDMPKEILSSALAAKNSAGQSIGQAIGQSQATVNLPSLISRLETDVLSNARSGGSLYEGVANKVAGHIEDLKKIQAALGDDVPAAMLQELKVKLGNVIDWRADKPLAQALQRAYGIEAGTINKAVKGAGFGDQLAAANRRFGLAADLEKTAKKGAEGVANREMGLSEQIGASGGTATGAAIGATIAGAPGAVVGAPIGGFIGGAAQNYWRKHGSGVAARAMSGGASSLDAIMDRLTSTPQMQSYADLFRRTAAAAGPAGAAALHFQLFDKDPTYRAAVMAGEQNK